MKELCHQVGEFSIVGKEQPALHLSCLEFNAALRSDMQLTPKNTPAPWLSEKSLGTKGKNNLNGQNANWLNLGRHV